MNSFDRLGYHALNNLAGHIPVLDFIMSFLAQYALEVYALLFIVAWFTVPKPDTRHRHALVIMGLSAILALIINLLISHIWFRPRPFVTLSKGTFTQFVPHTADSSFPSDTTAGSFGFAAGSWNHAQGWVNKSFTVLAILVAISRVYVGVHWPTDVLAGMTVGIISARIMWKFNTLAEPLTDLGLRLFKFGKYAKSIPASGE